MANFELNSNFDRFQERKQHLLEAVAQLGELVQPQALIPSPSWAPQVLERFRQDLSGDLRFRLLCVGDFSTGKSSFINRFLLEQDLLPAFATPTTTALTRIRHGDTLRARLYWPIEPSANSTDESPNFRIEEINDDLATCLRERISTEGQKQGKEQVPILDLEAPAPRLAAGIEVVDAPGLNDTNQERMQLTLNYLEEADAILFFINAMQPWTNYAKQFFESELLSRDNLARVFVLVNYWDQVPEGERPEVLAYIQQQMVASLRKAGRQQAQMQISLTPLSAKTGENADLLQTQVFDVLGERKFTDVLSLRLHKFNGYVESYLQVLDAQLARLHQDRKQRETQGKELAQEIAEYKAQSEQFLADLNKGLRVEFDIYRTDLAGLFDDLLREVAQIFQGLNSASMDVKQLNERLSARMKTLQARLSHRLQALDLGLMERIRDLVERYKGNIDAPPSQTLNLDDYFLQWPSMAEAWQATGAQVSRVVGVAGLLLGTGALVPTLTALLTPAATTGFFSSVGAFLFGAPVVAASPWLALGIPGLLIGIVAFTGSFYFKALQQAKIAEALAKVANEMEDKIEQQKWELCDGLQVQRDARVAQLCQDVDSEILRAYRHKQEEFAQLNQIQDNGEGLKALRAAVAALPLEVNS
ncbi:MAG: dynamin family protein [Gammaproteobacteria bacterium]|nr:dynamin family protein [Gammaproteobacteria bacterium]